MKHLVENGAFGKITEFENHYDVDNPPWIQKWNSPDLIPGEGMLYGLGTHSLDQTMQLFGAPSSVTAFTRSLRMESRTDDSFTVILQYAGEQRDLLVTVKTTVVSPLPPTKQLKYWVRGTKGSFVKYGEDVQIDQLLGAGLKANEPGFGVEPEEYHGTLSTTTAFDEKVQQKDEASGHWIGKFPSAKGSYMDYYRDVVAAIRGERDLVVKPEESRDVIRLIELARDSAEKGVTVAWSARQTVAYTERGILK